ncbi:MAG: hypothetical protein ACLQBX_15800 [Candidatus Limnocylindrales bacterium]
MTIDELFAWLGSSSDDAFPVISKAFRNGGWTQGAQEYANRTSGALIVSVPPEEWRASSVLTVPFAASSPNASRTPARHEEISHVHPVAQAAARARLSSGSLNPTFGDLLLWTAWSRGLSPHGTIVSFPGLSDPLLDDVQLVPSGGSTPAPPSPARLLLAGIDPGGVLHIQVYDASGNLTTDTDDTQLPSDKALAIRALKQEIPGLLPPHVLTSDEKTQVIQQVAFILSQQALILRFVPMLFPERSDRPLDLDALKHTVDPSVTIASETSVDDVVNQLETAVPAMGFTVHDALRPVPIEFPALTNVSLSTALDELARRLQAAWDWFPTGDPVKKVEAGYDLRLMSWGDGSGMPTSGNNLAIVGTDNNGLLHIRIFDAGGNRVTDTDETKLPSTQAAAISTLKQQLPALLPPHVLTGAEKSQVLTEVTSIFGQTLEAVVVPVGPFVGLEYRMPCQVP